MKKNYFHKRTLNKKIRIIKEKKLSEFKEKLAYSNCISSVNFLFTKINSALSLYAFLIFFVILEGFYFPKHTKTIVSHWDYTYFTE